jgi:hypothetical protein
MRWPFAIRRSSAPLDDLLAVLDEAAGEGSPLAALHARAIRQQGTPAVDRFIAEAASHARGCASMVTTTRVVGAAADYDLEANGHDWRAAPTEHERARMVPTPAQFGEQLEARALKARAAALARIQASTNARQLAAVRGTRPNKETR